MTDVIPEFPLYIDSRTGSLELTRYIGIPIQVVTLDYADAAFMGFGPENRIFRFGVERKTWGDLVGCIEDGRLSGHQLTGLLNHYHVVYLVVEGQFKTVDGDLFTAYGKQSSPVGGWKRRQRFTYQQVSNFLQDIQVIAGVKFWYTRDMKETAIWIRHTYYHFQKKWEDHKSHMKFHKPPIPRMPDLVPPNPLERALSQFTNISWERASLLADHFKSMDNLLKAAPEDIMAIKGFGKILAKSLYEELHYVVGS